MQVEGRQPVAARDERCHAGQPRQQARQRRLHLQHDPRAGADQRHVAAELQGVAEALLGMQQDDDAIPDRLAVPQRRGEAPGVAGEVPGLPPPLIVLPALRQPPGQQQHIGEVAVRLGEARPQAQRLAVARLGLRRLAEVPRDGAEIVVCVRIVRPQAQGVAVGRGRFHRLAELAQGVAEIAMRLGIVRPEAQRRAAARRRLRRAAEIA